VRRIGFREFSVISMFLLQGLEGLWAGLALFKGNGQLFEGVCGIL